jgi:hypothetical protein
MPWVRGAAIRPVPPHAVVGRACVDAVEAELASEAPNDARGELDAAFRRFETTQPDLADRIADVLAKPLDEAALALGYFLSIAVWLAFERSFGDRLGQVTEESIDATEAALALEEELRAAHAEDPFDLDDVVAMEQPDVLAFVHEHVEAALDPSAAEREVDVDDVHVVYRAILVLVLALSHAVLPPGGRDGVTKELLA